MTTKCSYGHDNVCANVMHLRKKIKIDNIFLVIFLIKKYPVFIIF